MENREIKFRFWDKALKKMIYRKPHYNFICLRTRLCSGFLTIKK